MQNKTNVKQSGVVILFAVLLVTVVLTISLGVYGITYRQLLLSSFAKESEIAFAVADSARNCAQYLDSKRVLNERPFGYWSYGESSPGSADFVWTLNNPTGTPTVDCAGSWAVTQADGSDSRTSTFYMDIPIETSRHTCAAVKVVKSVDGADHITTVTVDGYNVKNATGPGVGTTDCTPTDLNRAVNRRIVSITKG